VLIHGSKCRVKGGKQTRIIIKTVRDWCRYYGLQVNRNIVILFKALNDDYSSPYGMSYKPGTIPIAVDWDGGKKECGEGLHFSPSPRHAIGFHNEAKRYCACPVNLKDIAVHPDGDYPEKVKAKGCCAPVWECDIDGNKIESKKGGAVYGGCDI
jgi:hypothetical protein